jgi:hypothetical protein
VENRLSKVDTITGSLSENVVCRSDLSAEQIVINRRKLFFLMLIPILIIVSAQLLWLAVQRGQVDLLALLGTRNQGLLLSSALNVKNLPMLDVEGQPWFISDQYDWYLLLRHSGDCDQACIERNRLSHNIHLALGREFNRVQVIELYPSSAKRNVPSIGSIQLILEPSLWQGLFVNQPAAAQSDLYVLDSQGYIALHYPLLRTQFGLDRKFGLNEELASNQQPGLNQHSRPLSEPDQQQPFSDSVFSGKQVLKDVKFLLKTSQVRPHE